MPINRAGRADSWPQAGHDPAGESGNASPRGGGSRAGGGARRSRARGRVRSTGLPRRGAIGARSRRRGRRAPADGTEPLVRRRIGVSAPYTQDQLTDLGVDRRSQASRPGGVHTIARDLVDRDPRVTRGSGRSRLSGEGKLTGSPSCAFLWGLGTGAEEPRHWRRHRLSCIGKSGRRQDVSSGRRCR